MCVFVLAGMAGFILAFLHGNLISLPNLPGKATGFQFRGSVLVKVTFTECVCVSVSVCEW